MAKPLIIAHRGASAEETENTLPAFHRALALGAEVMELDARVTSDGVAVVFHDQLLRRLTGEPGQVATSTWKELRRLAVRGGGRIPRLAHVLRAMKGRAVVHIEIKPGVPVAPVVEAIKSARAAEWVIIGSFSLLTVQEARRLAPPVPRMLISEGRAPRGQLLRQIVSCDANGISVNFRAVKSAAWVRWFQARGYSVWCWTVNDADDASRLAEWGLDGIMGDNPALLRRFV